MSTDRDQSQALVEAVRSAFETDRHLRIAGSGSKGFLSVGREAGEQPAGRLLSVADHCGIVDYRPEELVITARAGTPLKDVERLLAQHGQYLPFEPPRFHGGGTLGGAVASGLAGPGAPWRGGVRDGLLGVDMINGRGERLVFGGQVMKNVAGYDISRLQAGAFGTLGVLLEISVKVLPRPERERTLAFELEPAAALEHCRAWLRRPYPISATSYHDGVLRLRLSGAGAGVDWAVRELGGEVRDDDYWRALRDHRVSVLGGHAEGRLWRATVAPAAREPLAGCLVTWGGAQRWWRQQDDVAPSITHGHARAFDGRFGLRTSSDTATRRYLERVKQAFDPAGVLNPELSPRSELVHAD